MARNQLYLFIYYNYLHLIVIFATWRQLTLRKTFYLFIYYYYYFFVIVNELFKLFHTSRYSIIVTFTGKGGTQYLFRLSVVNQQKKNNGGLSVCHVLSITKFSVKFKINKFVRVCPINFAPFAVAT